MEIVDRCKIYNCPLIKAYVFFELYGHQETEILAIPQCL